MVNWFVRHSGKPVETFTTDDLRQAVREGRINRDSEIASSESGPWQSISRVKGLDWPSEAIEPAKEPEIVPVEAEAEVPPPLLDPARDVASDLSPQTEELLRDIALSLKVLTDHDTRREISFLEVGLGILLLFCLAAASATRAEMRVESLLNCIGFFLILILLLQINRTTASPILQYQARAKKDRKIRDQMELARAAGKRVQTYLKQ